MVKYHKTKRLLKYCIYQWVFFGLNLFLFTLTSIEAIAQKSEITSQPVVKPKIVFLDTCPQPKVVRVNSKNAFETIAPGAIEERTGSAPLVSFVNYSTEQGLALSTISCGLKDRDGNLWFGTFGGGLSRFNGKSFTNFTNANGLPANNVKCLAEDNVGNIWVGTEFGLSIYNGKYFNPLIMNYEGSTKFILNTKAGHVLFSQGTIPFVYMGTLTKEMKEELLVKFIVPPQFRRHKISKAFESENGDLWFTTDKRGLLRYRGKSPVGDTTGFTAYTTADGLINNTVEAIEEDNKGNMWFVTHTGISRFDGKSFTSFTADNGLVDNVVLTVKKDSKGNMWFGTNKGVSCYNDNIQNTGLPLFMNYTINEGLANNRVLSITEDNYANIWFGTYGGGISKFGGRSVNLYSNKQGLTNNNIRSIMEDRKGNIWLGSINGEVSVFDGKSFKDFKLDIQSTNNVILSIAEDRKGNLWFGTSVDGAVCYDGDFKSGKTPILKAITKTHGLVNNTVRYIFEDRKGNLWFGTNNQGVSCYIPGENNEDGMVVTYTTDHGLPLGTVWSILEDRSGCLWFGCTNGLARFDGKSFTTYTTNQGMVDNIVGPITEDKNGNIWIGTGNGLSCFVNKTSFLTFTTAQGLGDNVIYDMEIGSAPGSAINEKKNALYLGTNQGFSVLTGFKDKKGHVFSFEDPTLYKDPDLKNFTPVFEIYNNKTGYLIKDLNTNAMCITKTGLPTLDEKVRSGVGIIWGGCGDDKVVRFDPFSVNKNNIPLKVIIQGVKINEEKISWYNLFQSDRETAKSDSLAAINEEVITFGNALTIDERDTLQKRFGDIKFDSISRWYPVPQNLALPYNHNNITFDFAAIETDKHFLVRYQYILEGYDKSWSPITDKSSVTFGNIYEGMYTFRLKACSPAGIWCEPIVYTFKVLPPWWRTWWMYAVYSLSVMSLIAGFIKWRERNLKKEKALLEQKVELRTKELDERNKVVEEKNKDILDSIHYAKRIQDALLKEEEHTSPHLPDHFVLFIPKDIVSGDFHWAMEKEDHWYVAAVDCTGHGVPGAFMSMLGMSFLNDIVSGTELLIPAEILNRLRDKIVKELRQTGESGGSKDGMDISLIRLNLKTKELQWAGANNALTVVKNGNMNEIKADKQPIGYHPEQKKFTNHTVQLYSGESVYIYTDGYADQFGGPKGKKFKYKQLEHLILENNQLPLIKQKELLKKTFNDWKGNLEQLDDVCIIGVKV